MLARGPVASPIECVDDGIAGHEPMLDNRRRSQCLPVVRKAAHSHNVPLTAHGLLRRSKRYLHLDRPAERWGEARAKQYARVADVLSGPSVPMGRADRSKPQRQVQRKARRSNNRFGHEKEGERSTGVGIVCVVARYRNRDSA